MARRTQNHQQGSELSDEQGKALRGLQDCIKQGNTVELS
jgi:hypothetical protein